MQTILLENSFTRREKIVNKQKYFIDKIGINFFL
jgi:hypothetical protein